MRNRHIVDQFADLTLEIKALTDKRDVLKQQILANLPPIVPGESATVAGDDYVASIAIVESERLDRKAVEARLSGPKFQQCLKSSSSVRVTTAPRKQMAA